MSNTKRTPLFVLIGSAVCFVVALFFVHWKIRTVDAARQEEKAEINSLRQTQSEADQHIYELVLLHIAKSKMVSAIEIDKKGNVVSMNKVAQDTFYLNEGDNINTIIPNEYKHRHDEKMMVALSQQNPTRILKQITCAATPWSRLRPPPETAETP